MVIGGHGQHTVLVQLHVVVDIKEELELVVILNQRMMGDLVLVKMFKVDLVTLKRVPTCQRVRPTYSVSHKKTRVQMF